MIHFRWKWMCNPAKKVEDTIKLNMIDQPIITSGSQYQYVLRNISQNPRRANIKTTKKIIKFSQNCGLTCGDISHSSLDLSYSAIKRSITSLKESTLNSYFKSQSFWYSSCDTRIIGYFSLLRPGMNVVNSVNTINTFEIIVFNDNKLYIGG